MSKSKVAYACNDCGAIANKWAGQCGECNSWNSLTETIAVSKNQANQRYKGYAGALSEAVTLLEDVPLTKESRITTGLSELDRVLGGGLVNGSVILIGGDPGIGKSTLVLQCMANLSQERKVLYVTGEESLQQVKMRADRLKLSANTICMLAETQVENVIRALELEKPKAIVLDSIQTMYTELLPSAPGSVSQLRESAAQLVNYAKKTGTALFFIGHVTKEGSLAGPRVLEHMVDTVMYFEGVSDSQFRMLRAVKNRFGAVNELGVFAMTDKGLKEINNPSAIFLTRFKESISGSIVMATKEGTRPMLVEIQALVDESHLGNPRRVAVGLDQNRLSIILAVLHRHTGVASFNQDIFINVVGGVKITETASDLPVLLAIISSLKNINLQPDLIAFGEIGLSGEIRPVQSGQERLKEAQKLGFTKAVIPELNSPKKPIDGMEIISIKHVSEIFGRVF